MLNGRILVAVMMISFLIGIQLLILDSYQTLFPTYNKNENHYFTISADENDDDEDEDAKDDDNKDEDAKDEDLASKICSKLLDSETCKKVVEEITKKDIITKPKKLTEEEIKAEAIKNKYLEPATPTQDNINNLEQTNENIQTGKSEVLQNEIPQPNTINPPPPPGPMVSPTETNPPPPGPFVPPTETTSPPPPPGPMIPPSNSSNSGVDLNTLDENELINAISFTISQVHNFDKNKITQALFELTASTKAKGGDVLKSLRQIGTIILENPSGPLGNKILEIAKTK